MTTTLDKAVDLLEEWGVDKRLAAEALLARTPHDALGILRRDPRLADAFWDLETAWAVDLPQSWHRAKWDRVAALQQAVSDAVTETNR